MKKILFPTDGSTECQKALDMAEEMANVFDATITVYNVFSDKDLNVGEGPNIAKYVARNMGINKEVIEKTVEYFNDRGVRCDYKLATGDPASKIIDEAENEGYDLVIMCTHGMSATKRFLMGSVTNKVVHHVNVPLLIIR